jgi:DNA-binding XRE family transcriptional regulator
MVDISTRFEASIDKDGPYSEYANSNCWNWTGTKDKNGYGSISVGGKKGQLTHRVSWQLYRGEIPEKTAGQKTCVLHKCDNPSCVNPDHLFLGSQLDNIADRDNKNRHRALRGEDNGFSKLDSGQVEEIRRLYSTKEFSQSSLARRFGVAQNTISGIVRGIAWKTDNLNYEKRDYCGENHVGAKLTWDKVRQIRGLHSTGRYTQEYLGEMFGVSRRNISKVVAHQTWVE